MAHHERRLHYALTRLTLWKIWCRCNFKVWLAAQIEWKSLKLQNSQVSDRNEYNIFKARPSKHDAVPAAMIPQEANRAQVLGNLRLQITILNQLPARLSESILSKSKIVNGYSLTKDVFSNPIIYTAQLEKGNFIAPCGIGFFDAASRERYTLRLVFDRSPYPPLEAWKDLDRGPREGLFWMYAEFVARWDKNMNKAVCPMNDEKSSGWGQTSCVVSSWRPQGLVSLLLP